MFTEPFCHPVNVTQDTTPAELSMCLVMVTNATCESVQPMTSVAFAGCVWSKGEDLIPDHDFCAPMEITTDAQLVQSCISA
jgi:hypothetical protein